LINSFVLEENFNFRFKNIKLRRPEVGLNAISCI